MAAVTICSDFGAQEKSLSLFPLSPSICHEVMGLDAMILVSWMLSFFWFVFCFLFFNFLFLKKKTSNSCPRQGSPRLRNPKPQTARQRQKTGRAWRERPGRLEWVGAAASTPCSRRQVPGELSAPGQNCVKVAGLSGKLPQPLANRPTRKRKKVKGNLQSPSQSVLPSPQASAQASGSSHARRPQRVPRCAPVHAS